MKNGHCPMCNSNEVYANHAVRFFSSNTKVVLNDADMNMFPKTAFTPYICAKCGFTAMYVQEMDAIKDISTVKGWEKAT